MNNNDITVKACRSACTIVIKISSGKNTKLVGPWPHCSYALDISTERDTICTIFNMQYRQSFSPCTIALISLTRNIQSIKLLLNLINTVRRTLDHLGDFWYSCMRTKTLPLNGFYFTIIHIKVTMGKSVSGLSQ